MSPVFASVVDLNGPGKYLHWSIFQVSVSNLVLILVMIVIFGLALMFPFPKHKEINQTEPADEPSDDVKAVGTAPSGASAGTEDDTSKMWTAKIRNFGLKVLPPGKLLPDHQPAYVSSWIYVFGVGSLAALGMAIISGFALALGGPDWWHSNTVGHFFNSMHLWSVELFMALLVIHLWGKFWMSAWRGKRALTWMTGVIAFMASVVECFTGYLSQQNFDSQWISTNGKDAINATGLGGFFNLMNFGQMLMWHIVLIPIVLIAIIGAHVLLVRVRGVSHPLPQKRTAFGPKGLAARMKAKKEDAASWRGPLRRYDIIKEASAAFMIILILVLLLATLLSSPDIPPVTVSSWAKVAPADFLGTAASELNSTSETAVYGPPYNNNSGYVQTVIVSWQRLGGVREPINPATTFVLNPLKKEAVTDPALASALKTYTAAGIRQQVNWANNYSKALLKVKFKNGTPILPKADDGPVPLMLSSELALARSGALDTDLISNSDFYGTNFTKPLLFLEDGQYFSSLAASQHMTGSQWGVMNESGSYPGQPWLWLYTLWYQVPGFSSSANVDLIAIYLTGIATVLLLLVPFIPGIRDIPRLIPIHRLVWKTWYKNHPEESETSSQEEGLHLHSVDET
jgi:hypothetical protein